MVERPLVYTDSCLFRDQVAVEAMKTLLDKIPVPLLPGGVGGFERQQFIDRLVQDSFDIAIAMANRRNSAPIPF